MGQQQLLLVILVTIIVGIATVVAINTFSSAADSANLDAVRQDLATIASSAQSYYMKPEMLGGGGKDFDNMTFEGIAVPGEVQSTNTEMENQNGYYVLGTASGSGSGASITVTAYAASEDDYNGKSGTATFTATIEPETMSIADAGSSSN